jgi:hypothetical protein
MLFTELAGSQSDKNLLPQFTEKQNSFTVPFNLRNVIFS